MARRFYRADSMVDLSGFLDRGFSANLENRWTFEIAWEVANKGTCQLIIPLECIHKEIALANHLCLSLPNN